MSKFNIKAAVSSEAIVEVVAESPDEARASAEQVLRGQPGVQRVSVLSVMPAVEPEPEPEPAPLDPAALTAALAVQARIPKIVEAEWPKALDGLGEIFERWNVRDTRQAYVGDDVVTACAVRCATLMAAVSNYMAQRLPPSARTFAAQLMVELRPRINVDLSPARQRLFGPRVNGRRP